MQQDARRRIWMHCASLGEFEQGRPVLEQLRREFPEHALILTFFSPSGYEVRKHYEGVDYVYYLPFDGPGHAKRFLNLLKPDLALFVKYEYWFFYLHELRRRRIKTLMIAALYRADQPFFAWYGTLHRRMLQAFDQIFVQDAASASLLASIGFASVTVGGDPRFDRVLAIAGQNLSIPLAESLVSGHKVLVAGSTWPDDDQLLLQWWNHYQPEGWKMIIVPHETHEKHIQELSRLFGKESALWTEATETTIRDKRIIIVNTVGLLAHLYRYATLAYIGGGFGKAGIHNVLEAAVYGLPCLHGPVFHQFLEAIALCKAGGSFVVHDWNGFATTFQRLTSDSMAYQDAATASTNYVAGMAGATEKIMGYLREK